MGPLIQPSILFDHVRKTGGTSVYDFMRELFGDDDSTQKLACKLSQALIIYKDKKFISGHFAINPTDEIPPDWLGLTIVRDPRERTLSDLYFVKNDIPHSQLTPIELRISQCSIENAFSDQEICAYFSNYQCKHFASFFHSATSQLPELQLLTSAKKGLDRYDLVGTTENLAEFSAVLKRVFTHESMGKISHKNRTTIRTAFLDLPQEIQRIIENINRADIELWHYAQQLFKTKTKYFQLTAKSSTETIEVDKQQDNFCTPICSLKEEDGVLNLLDVTIGSRFRGGNSLISGEDTVLSISFRCQKDIDDLTIGYSVLHESGLTVFGVNTRLMGYKLSCVSGQDYYVAFTFPMVLGIGGYIVNVSAHPGLDYSNRCYFRRNDAAVFSVESIGGIQFEGLVDIKPSVLFSNEFKYEEITNESLRFRRIGFASLGPVAGSIRTLANCPIVRPYEQFSVPIEITNSGSESWYCEGTQQVNIAYHWRDMDGNHVLFDGARTPLPSRVVNPGNTLRGFALVEVPNIIGQFILELTLVQENVFWFEDRGFQTAKCEIEVRV